MISWSPCFLLESTNTFLVYLVDKDKCVVFAFCHLQSAKHGTITNRFQDLHHRQIYITTVGQLFSHQAASFWAGRSVLAKTNETFPSFPCYIKVNKGRFLKMGFWEHFFAFLNVSDHLKAKPFKIFPKWEAVSVKKVQYFI